MIGDLVTACDARHDDRSGDRGVRPRRWSSATTTAGCTGRAKWPSRPTSVTGTGDPAGTARDRARVARVPQADPAARSGQCRLHFPESGSRARSCSGRHPGVGRRARRPRGTEGRARGRRARLPDPRQFHRERRRRLGRRHPAADRAMQARGPGALRRGAARGDRLSGIRSMTTTAKEPEWRRCRLKGGRRLSGRVAVEGNKNSALPLIAACLLTDQPCELSNVPRIRDVEVLLEILAGLGATVEGAGTPTLGITARGSRPTVPTRRSSARLRGIGAAARAAPGAEGLGAPGAAGGRFSGAPDDCHPSPGAGGARGACRSTSPATRWRRRGA